MKHLKDLELNDNFPINESDNQTWRKIQFIKEQIRNITKTIREIDWAHTTPNEKDDIILSLDNLKSTFINVSKKCEMKKLK